jgi:hypothetical protein
MLIDLVSTHAQERGLRCERATDVRPGVRKKCLRIAGYACQIVPLRLYPTGSNFDLVLHALYLPRSEWPDFVIYVCENAINSPIFFIVPRGELSTETGVCAKNNWLFKYQDAWSLLSEGIAKTKLTRRFRETPTKLMVVVRKANILGLLIERIKLKNAPSKHVRDRLLINGRKCQVLSAGGLRSKAHQVSPIINLNLPNNPWAEFLIFVVPSTNIEHVFILPRSRLLKKTTTTLASKWLAEYADNWDLLGPGMSRTSAGL